MTTRPILLVEDNPMDVDLTLRAFRRQKVSNPIEVARNGEEALEWLDRWHDGAVLPAVILLDLKLPRVDGLEVLRRFKSHPRVRAVPIVVLTTSAEHVDVQRAYDLGANSYIVKPVAFDKFIEVASQIEVYWTLLNVQPSDPDA
jgi:CheY-like chemotaxis protein